MSGTHWANIFSSVGSVATAGAFVLGGVALRRERIERLRSEVEGQASKVAVWLGTYSHQGGEDKDGDIRMAGDWPVIWIRNASDLPIYQWLAMAVDENQVKHVGLEVTDLAPGSSTYVYLPDALRQPIMAGKIRTAMRFVDSAGRHWMRQQSGELTPAGPHVRRTWRTLWLHPRPQVE